MTREEHDTKLREARPKKGFFYWVGFWIFALVLFYWAMCFVVGMTRLLDYFAWHGIFR